MEGHIRRKKYSIANKYQRLIMLPAIVANAALMLIVAIFIFYLTLNSFPVGANQYSLVNFSHAKIISILFLLIIAYCNTILLMWSHRVSHRLVGPIVRINRELNDVITGKRKNKKLSLRKDDYLHELIDTLNTILSRLP